MNEMKFLITKIHSKSRQPTKNRANLFLNHIIFQYEQFAPKTILNGIKMVTEDHPMTNMLFNEVHLR